MTMETTDLINQFINSHSEPKRVDIEELHRRILNIMPNCNLWFFDGKDDAGKVVSNPQIGYGHQTMHYADGKTKDFYQIGLSSNTSGISVYIMGIQNKKHLPETYGNTIGKANVTGYCIKFKSLKGIHIDILEEAIRDGVKQTS